MGKSILDFTTPTGQTGNVLRPSTWIPLIIGVVMFLAAFATGEKISKMVSGKLPLINTAPVNPFSAQPTAPASSGKEFIG